MALALKSVGEGLVVYVVDYDIPVDRRKPFYRALAKTLRGSCYKSTKSVVITPSFRAAEEVRRLALRYNGRANVYRAVKIG